LLWANLRRGKTHFFIGTKELLSGKPDFLVYKEDLIQEALTYYANWNRPKLIIKDRTITNLVKIEQNRRGTKV
jgi:hypothetical protein